MLPLGDAWSGECHADPDRPWQPDESTMRPLCNLGYARGSCPRFPAGEGPDAVRFAVSSDNGASLRICLVIERDHRPFALQPLEYSLADRAFAVPPADGIVTRQAYAYAETYLRRKADSLSASDSPLASEAPER